jgi:TFIIF-interacting CTD phosphatase-like protein
MKDVKLIPSDLDEKLKALIKERHCLMIYYNPTEETVSLNFPLKQGKLYHADTVSELLEKVVEDYQPKSELLSDLGNALNPEFLRTEDN